MAERGELGPRLLEAEHRSACVRQCWGIRGAYHFGRLSPVMAITIISQTRADQEPVSLEDLTNAFAEGPPTGR